MMVAVAVFAVFSVVAMRTLSLYLHLSRDAAGAEQAHRTFDSALARLRADVWAARAVSLPAAKTVALDLGQADGTVTWKATDEGALERTASNKRSTATGAPESQSWPAAGRGG